MPNDKFSAFTNRQEIIALFQQLYERDPKQPLPLLPLLLLLAPAGGGISTFIDLLKERSYSALTYASVDFAQNNAVVTLQGLLQNICDQLHLSDGSQQSKLTFPRCELAMSAMFDTPLDTNSRDMRKQIEQKISQGLPIYEHIDDLLNVVSNWLFLVSLLLFVCKWLLKGLEKHFLPLRDFIWGPAIKWYKKSYRSFGLPPSSDIIDLLMCIHKWSRPGESREHNQAVEKLLLEAFLEDMREAFDKKRTKSAAERTSFIVLFFDNFDVALQNGIGQVLLEHLLNSRFEGISDPLLVILGSHQRLFNATDPLQNVPFEQGKYMKEQQRTEYVLSLYQQWQKRSLGGMFESIQHLLLPLWLYDFDLKDTTTYLLRVLGQRKLENFAFAILAENVYDMTYGHPLALKIVTDTLKNANLQGRDFPLYKIWEEPVSSTPIQIADYEQKTLEAYLCSVLLYQLSDVEQEQLVDLAVPRVLDFATLKVLLAANDTKEVLGIWNRYSKFCFVRIYDGTKMIMHPLVRDLLARRLNAKSTVRRDYYKVIHSNLREYFSELATSSSIQEQVNVASVEEAYHALAVGDTETAIANLYQACMQEGFAWKSMLDSIVKAPTTRMPADIKQQARQALSIARDKAFAGETELQMRSAVAALVLYSWLLNAPEQSMAERIDLWRELSETYRYVLVPERKFCLQIAKDYYEQAYATEMKNNHIVNEISVLSPPSMELFKVRNKSKTWSSIRSSVSILCICVVLLSYLTMYYGKYANIVCSPSSLLSPWNVLNATLFSRGIGTIHAGDGECIGINDGTVSFNYEDPSHADALIYAEDQRVLDLSRSEGRPYVTVILLTTLTSKPENMKSAAKGRSDLQGAYIAQIEHNKKDGTNPLLRLLIANTGGDSRYAKQVAEQIVVVAHNDPTFVAVLGPTQSREETFAATKILVNAHIPIISGTASGDKFTNISPYFFRVVPPNKKQVSIAVAYIEQQWKSKRAIVFEDPKDYYSKNLADDFSLLFQSGGDRKIITWEQYDPNVKGIGVGDVIDQEVRDACKHHPDLIYFTGRSDAMLTMISAMNNLIGNMSPCGPVKIMGGDTLDLLNSSPNDKFPYYPYDIYYTSFGFSSEWDESIKQPPKLVAFLNDYSEYFDPPDGHNPPSGQVMLSYDATWTLLNAITQIFVSENPSFQAGRILSTLKAVHGTNAVQGVSGLISFGPDGDPIDKVVVVLRIDQHGIVHLVPEGIKGRK